MEQFPVLLFVFCFLMQWCQGFYVLNRTHASEFGGLCAQLILPLGYPCVEHTVKTRDGFLLAVQHIPYGQRTGEIRSGSPVFLQHGLFQGGDTWFINSVNESLGFILADHGFDVWVGNVRGTHWSHGHISWSTNDREYWDWSWQDLAWYDLVDMINFVYEETTEKVFLVGHSQGTIMALAALAGTDVVKKVEAVALLCPISYLDHLSSRLILRAVKLHLDEMLMTVGIHQLNFRSEIGIHILDTLCDGHINCDDMLASITGKNCCFNRSRTEFYLEYEPHPSSTKNLNHLFQMIRKGSFAKYDYGLWGNLRRYGTLQPPTFNITNIPKWLPLWMAYGGTDALADLVDVKRTISELQSKPELLYLDHYGHLDFIWSVTVKEDVFDKMIEFFRACGRSSSY